MTYDEPKPPEPKAEPAMLYASVEIRHLDKLLRNKARLYDGGGAQGKTKRSLMLEETIDYLERQAADAKKWGGTDVILAMSFQPAINLFVAISLWVGGKTRIGDPMLGAKYAILQAFHPSKWFQKEDRPPELQAAIQRNNNTNRPFTVKDNENPNQADA